MKKNIVILISGGGSNMAALVRAAQRDDWAGRFGARVAAVISNKQEAVGLDFAKSQGIETHVVDHRLYPTREEFDIRLAEVISAYDAPGSPVLVLLAGFMRILSQAFVEKFSGRLVNIHPSLLPAFEGLHTHQRALDAGCKFAGATVHLVTPQLDKGPILEQAVVPVLEGDTAQTLAARVLTQEHVIYAKAVTRLLQAQT
ncbi:MAG: phosphoribosylglycinamide formyltransferase [Rhodoferax sp.]|nr:phosphoribosylglycinamide formyltransferase [Rhodoferax sp.]